MYGMLLESIQHFIQTNYGEENWKMIIESVGDGRVVFATHEVYRDSLMLELADACSKILQDRTTEQYMVYFGTCFVKYFTHYGYDKVVRLSGRYYRDFLYGIDNLHETMRFSFPNMRSPSFIVHSEDSKGCVLEYRSKRVGFTYYTMGQLRQVGMKFYDQRVDVQMLQEDISSQGCNTRYRVNFDNNAFMPADIVQKNKPWSSCFSTISSKTFFKVFRFCLVFDMNMIIIHAGDSLHKMFPGRLVHQNITKVFTLRRPLVEFNWKNVTLMKHVAFEMESCIPHDFDASTTEVLHYCPSKPLLLKGQMRFCDDLNGVAFLCNPLVDSLDTLRNTGLFLNDLNSYDGSQDWAIKGWHHSSSLEISIEQEIERTRRIEANLKRLDEWKRRGDALVYSMLPKTIAKRLQQGEDPLHTWESFEKVTIMFSHLIGFTEVCAKMSATDLVQCINSIFTIFDAVVEKHDVLKVETVGDAGYMVVGGVPSRSPQHANQVAMVALELKQKVRMVYSPLAFSIRIGMDSGSVVAGVVGERMPQYCLFGDTVNTASRMQTFGQPARIHLSKATNDCLDKGEWVTIHRGRVFIKGKGEMDTYWLAGRLGDVETYMNIKQLKRVQSVCEKYDTQQKKGLRFVRPNSESDFQKFSKLETIVEDVQRKYSHSDIMCLSYKQKIDICFREGDHVERPSFHLDSVISNDDVLIKSDIHNSQDKSSTVRKRTLSVKEILMNPSSKVSLQNNLTDDKRSLSDEDTCNLECTDHGETKTQFSKTELYHFISTAVNTEVPSQTNNEFVTNLDTVANIIPSCPFTSIVPNNTPSSTSLPSEGLNIDARSKMTIGERPFVPPRPKRTAKLRRVAKKENISHDDSVKQSENIVINSSELEQRLHDSQANIDSICSEYEKLSNEDGLPIRSKHPCSPVKSSTTSDLVEQSHETKPMTENMHLHHSDCLVNNLELISSLSLTSDSCQGTGISNCSPLTSGECSFGQK